MTIAGHVFGTDNWLDNFGIVAENVGAVRVAGIPFVLAASNSNDDVSAGIRVNEI